MVRSWLKTAGVYVLAVGLFGAALGLLRGGAHAAETPPQKATPAPIGTKPLIDTDFSKGTFAALDWMPSGAWDIFTYAPRTANNPGAVARFPARKADGSLTKTFAEVRNPRKLHLSVDYGWGGGKGPTWAWGSAGKSNIVEDFLHVIAIV